MTGEMTQAERVAEYEELSDAELADRVEKTLETARWAEEQGQNDLRSLCLSRLSAMDEVVPSGDATEVLA
jgi:hypothetical protein